jgi:hypothetical protein
VHLGISDHIHDITDVLYCCGYKLMSHHNGCSPLQPRKYQTACCRHPPMRL